jgi:hypothetical protein
MNTQPSRGLFSPGERGENERVSLNYFLLWLKRKAKVKSDPPVNKCWRKLIVYLFTVVLPVNLQTSSLYEIGFCEISHFRLAFITNRSRDSSVGVATGYGLDDRGVGVRVPVGSRIFHSATSRPALGPTQPPIQWVPVVKRPGRIAGHSHPTSAKVKKTWIYTSTPPYVFMA